MCSALVALPARGLDGSHGALSRFHRFLGNALRRDCCWSNEPFADRLGRQVHTSSQTCMA